MSAGRTLDKPLKRARFASRDPGSHLEVRFLRLHGCYRDDAGITKLFHARRVGPGLRQQGFIALHFSVQCTDVILLSARFEGVQSGRRKCNSSQPGGVGGATARNPSAWRASDLPRPGRPGERVAR